MFHSKKNLLSDWHLIVEVIYFHYCVSTLLRFSTSRVPFSSIAKFASLSKFAVCWYFFSSVIFYGKNRKDFPRRWGGNFHTVGLKSNKFSAQNGSFFLIIIHSCYCGLILTFTAIHFIQLDLYISLRDGERELSGKWKMEVRSK